jgi:hypothetical protein
MYMQNVGANDAVVNVRRVTSDWDESTLSGSLLPTDNTTNRGSWPTTAGGSPRWMSTTITSLVQDWKSGAATNFGLKNQSTQASTSATFQCTSRDALTSKSAYIVANNSLFIKANSSVDAGFARTADSDPFTSGQEVTYTVQSALTAGTYYWRVRAIDIGGSKTWGAWSSVRSFTVTAGSSSVSPSVSPSLSPSSSQSPSLSPSSSVSPSIPQDPPTVVLDSPSDTSTVTDTTPDLKFTGTDTNSNPVVYQVQVHTSNTFGTAIDSYDTGPETGFALNDQYFAYGQSFSGNGGTLDTVKFYIRKAGSPTGTATAKIYAITGTSGSTGKPTGAALATSGTLDVTTLSTSYALESFQFTGGDQITLSNGTDYCVV